MRISDWSSDVCSSDLPGFADVTLSLEFLHWLPLGHDRTDAGLCIKSRNSRSARTNAFSQRPLRIKLQFQLTFHIELLKQLVFADIRADHLGDLNRKSVVWGKSVSVRVEFGGSRIIQKKKPQ